MAIAMVGAGCVQSPVATQDASDLVSQVLSPDVLAEHTPIKAKDGVTIDAWVFRPQTDVPVPVIINFSPYWSNLAPPAATGGDAFSLYLIDYFVPRGYAVALVSARGTGLSEGCFTIGGPLEIADEDQVATFLGEQPWSNGNVAATGKSYDGTMAQGLLTTSNPHVRTIVPVSPISELYKYTYFDGVPYTNANFNTYYTLLVSLQQSESPSDATYQKTPTRVCRESVDVQTSQYHSFATGDYSPYWQARNYTALLPDAVDASVFYIHGLSDWNVKPDNMVPWIEALRARGVPVKMWLGDWEHEYPTRPDFNETLLRWLDHYLKGIDTGIMDEPLVQVQSRDGLWRDEDDWPPVRAATLSLHPSADGTLGDAPGSGSGTYPDRPGTPLGSLPGPARETLVYTWTPDRDVRIVGAPILRASLSATGPRATISATLMVGEDVLGQGFRDLAHRSTLERSEPLQPGTPYTMDVHFFPQDVLVKAGQEVKLLVAHAPPRDAPVDSLAVPTDALVTLYHEGSVLLLPIVEASDIRPEAVQPEDVGCWAC